MSNDAPVKVAPDGVGNATDASTNLRYALPVSVPFKIGFNVTPAITEA